MSYPARAEGLVNRITAFLSRSPGLLNREPGGPAFLGHGPHSSIFSAQSGVLRAPSAGCWFSLQHLISNWLELPVHWVILLFYVHSIQPVDSQGYPLDTFDWMHLLFTQVYFLFWQLGRGQYATYVALSLMSKVIYACEDQTLKILVPKNLFLPF